MSNAESYQDDDVESHFAAERQMVVFVVQNRLWENEAACRDADPEIFYHDHEDDPDHLREDYCEFCPVRHDCLAHSIIHDDEYAIVRGGLLRAERQVLRRRYVEQAIARGEMTPEPEPEQPPEPKAPDKPKKPMQRRQNLNDKQRVHDFLVKHFRDRNDQANQMVEE